MQNYAPYQSFVSVQSEEQARAFPVVFGASVNFLDVNAPYIYIKSNFSQYQPPAFEKYRLVREEEQPVTPPPAPAPSVTQAPPPVPYQPTQTAAHAPAPAPQTAAPEYMTREDLNAAMSPVLSTLEALQRTLSQAVAPTPAAAPTARKGAKA